MGLEDIEQVESAEWWANQTVEVSEKFKESFKKASSWIKRTKKDEKKAKKYDFLLANFLVKIILDKKYTPIIDSLLKSIHSWYSSNFILGIVSLVNIDISNDIREISWKDKIEFTYISDIIIEFDDNNLNEKVRNRINLWVEDIIDITSIEYSSLITKHILDLLWEDEKTILTFTKDVFIFFLFNINISITEEKAESITRFILNDLKSSLSKLEIENI